MSKRFIIITSISLVAVVLLMLLNFGYQRNQYAHQLQQDLASFGEWQSQRLARLCPLLQVGQQDSGLVELEQLVRLVDAKQQLMMRLTFITLDAASMQSQGLAAPESYYKALAESHGQLVVSKPYTIHAMPHYPLLNFAISCKTGYLEQSIAVSSLSDYFSNRVKAPFAFKWTDNYWQPVILITGKTVIYFALQLGALVALFGVVASCVIMQRRARNLAVALDNERRCKQSLLAKDEIQQRYGTVVEPEEIQLVDLHALQTEAISLNSYLAQAMGIELVLPKSQTMLRAYLKPKLMLQVLSGVLGNMLRQNSSGAKIELELRLSSDTICFVFRDNGFYQDLEMTEVLNSTYDLAPIGWPAVFALADQHDMQLAHSHTVYVGNTILLSVARQKVNNVVSLEMFCD